MFSVTELGRFLLLLDFCVTTDGETNRMCYDLFR